MRVLFAWRVLVDTGCTQLLGDAAGLCWRFWAAPLFVSVLLLQVCLYRGLMNWGDTLLPLQKWGRAHTLYHDSHACVHECVIVCGNALFSCLFGCLAMS